MREMGRTERQARRVSGATSSVSGGPPEPTPEATEPGLVGTRIGWVSGVQPRLPSPAETNGTTGKKQKDE